MMHAAPALGVNLGGTKLSTVLLDTTGTRLWQRRVPTPASDHAGTLQAIAGDCSIGSAGASRDACSGFAAGLRG